MKHLFRFYAERSGEKTWILHDDEWHHLLKVLRLSAGEPLELANGEGWVGRARLLEVGKHKGIFEVESEEFFPAVASSEVFTLGLGVLKPAGIDEVLPGLVELGVNRLVLIPFIGMDKSRVSDKLLDRWQRQIISASKQAKAPWFPKLEVAQSLDSFLAEGEKCRSKYLLDPSGESLPLSSGSLPGPALAVIGSEGGWAEGEFAKFKASGFQLLRLQSHVLRATTAVIATAAIFRQALRLENPQ